MKNFTLSNILILKSFLNSPLIVNNYNNNFKNLNLKYFFSTLIISKNNLKIFNSKIFNFLKIPILISNGIQFGFIEKLGFSITQTYFDSIFYDTIFKDIKCPGGCIWIELSTIRAEIIRCGFLHCISTTSNYKSGGLNCYLADSIKCVNTCFFNCSSNNDVASFEIASHGGGVNLCQFNNTNELFGGKNEYLSIWSSGIGGNSLIYFQNNHSFNLIILTGGGGCGSHLLKTNSVNCGNYNQITSCYGSSIIAFHHVNGNKEFDYFNYLNNSCQNSYWITFSVSSTSILFKNSIFLNNINKNIISNGNLVSFSDCVFSNDLSSNNRIGTFLNSNNFNGELYNLVQINFDSTILCWARGAPLDRKSTRLNSSHTATMF